MDHLTEVGVRGQQVTYTPTLSTNATYKLQVKCKDSAGNESSAKTSNSYTLDTIVCSLLFLFNLHLRVIKLMQSGDGM